MNLQPWPGGSFLNVLTMSSNESAGLLWGVRPSDVFRGQKEPFQKNPTNQGFWNLPCLGPNPNVYIILCHTRICYNVLCHTKRIAMFMSSLGGPSVAASEVVTPTCRGSFQKCSGSLAGTNRSPLRGPYGVVEHSFRAGIA